MRALTHPLRIALLNFITDHEPVNVNKIYQALNVEQSVASQHLKILRDQNLVLTRRQGKFIFYSVNHAKLTRILKSVYGFTG